MKQDPRISAHLGNNGGVSNHKVNAESSQRQDLRMAPSKKPPPSSPLTNINDPYTSRPSTPLSMR
ncbi:hypothetical protein PENSUB_14051 [Penicillium subrubescens]|uniref:Uncharacterized protein n=1 Tax=Penicillium subrubescens TaxID=1316194 RepID=A0A1Q5UPP7_9EURO|nr:hypothetical protein PENSUB_14051 [Penicillium subrubescens]